MQFFINDWNRFNIWYELNILCFHPILFSKQSFTRSRINIENFQFPRHHGRVRSPMTHLVVEKRPTAPESQKADPRERRRRRPSRHSCRRPTRNTWIRRVTECWGAVHDLDTRINSWCLLIFDDCNIGDGGGRDACAFLMIQLSATATAKSTVAEDDEHVRSPGTHFR